MAEVKAFECEECGVLGRAESYEVGNPDDVTKPVTGYTPPDGWLYVTTQRIGFDVEPAKVFCTDKCRGLHFRPIQRRKGANGADDTEEGDSTP